MARRRAEQPRRGSPSPRGRPCSAAPLASSTRRVGALGTELRPSRRVPDGRSSRGLIASPRARWARCLSAGRGARRHNLRLCLGRRGWLACDAPPRSSTCAASQAPRRAVRIMLHYAHRREARLARRPGVVGRRARGLRRVVNQVDVCCGPRARRTRVGGPLCTCRRAVTRRRPAFTPYVTACPARASARCRVAGGIPRGRGTRSPARSPRWNT